MNDLDGRAVLVTGAASGIGEAVARGLGRIGAKVLVADVHAQRGTEVAAAINREGGRAQFVGLDVSTEQGVLDGFRDVQDLYGLVNVAGILTRVRLLEMDAAAFDKTIAINLRGYILCAREAARRMKEGRGGAIVNICSTNAHHGTPGLIHYAASKGGVLSATRAMAVELAEYGIRVNSVSPGVVATRLNADRLRDPAQVELSASHTALGRIGEPQDLFGVVEFLLSKRSAWITGSDILVDGGELAG